MYKTKSYLAPFPIEVPACMYSMKNLMQAVPTNGDSGSSPHTVDNLDELETLFSEIQSRLSALCINVDKLMKVHGLGAQQRRGLDFVGQKPTSIAVHCSPSDFPYALLDLVAFLKHSGRKIVLQLFQHSSLQGENVAKLTAAVSRLSVANDTADVDLTIRVILKSMSTECLTFVNSFSQPPLMGEAMLVRYISLLVGEYSEEMEVALEAVDYHLTTTTSNNTSALETLNKFFAASATRASIPGVYFNAIYKRVHGAQKKPLPAHVQTQQKVVEQIVKAC